MDKKKNIFQNNQRVKRCMLCVRQFKEIDYKNIRLLAKHLSSFSRILPRRYTGSCIYHQKMVATAIKRARYMGLMPYTLNHKQLHED